MRLRWLPALAGLLLISACSDSETPSPTEPQAVSPEAQIQIGPPGCPATLLQRVQLTQLFTQPGQIIIVNLKFTGIELAILARKTKLAQDLMFSLLEYTLDRYQKGELKGKKSADTQAKLIVVIKGLYCLVGLPAPNFSALALGPDGAAEVVQPSATETTTIVTDTRFAGVIIPPGAVTTTTLITITRLPDFPGPLNTVLDQYPAYYQYNSSSTSTFSTDVIVGTCQVQDFTPPDYSRLVIGHNVGTGIELLPRAPAPFLNCNDLLSMRDPANGWFQYVSRGWHSIEPVAARLLLPQKAYASMVGTCCLGGSSKSFSPFGAVDPLTVASATSPASFVGLAGTPVSAGLLPTIRVVTPQGHPVPGLPVTFSVPAGSAGSVSGATQTTNADGVARVGSWTLGTGPGPDRVVATVTPLTGSTVSGNPVSFTSEIATQPAIPYFANGYRYLVVGTATVPAGFQLPGYTGADAWPLGNGPFGSGHDERYLCALDDGVRTTWPAAANITAIPPDPFYLPGVSEILVRKNFLVPTGWTAGATVRVAIDNDIQVFVNGVDITASGGSSTLFDGFQIHENCAGQGDFRFTIPANVLLPGASNLIAIRARDRGKTSYVDVEVRLGE